MSETREKDMSLPVSSKRLWFGFAGSAFAWILAGLLNVLLAWQACMGGEAGSSMFTQTWIWVVLGIITFGLLATGITAGIVSYRNWRLLSRDPSFMSAEGRDWREFLAVTGVFISASLGAGMIWFAIPIYIVRMCVRAH